MTISLLQLWEAHPTYIRRRGPSAVDIGNVHLGYIYSVRKVEAEKNEMAKAEKKEMAEVEAEVQIEGLCRCPPLMPPPNPPPKGPSGQSADATEALGKTSAKL